jgi:putative aminopeptidase FrvX
LKLSKIGGYAWNTVEGEGCTVFSSQGEAVRGSLLLTKASAHVHAGQVNELKRKMTISRCGWTHFAKKRPKAWAFWWRFVVDPRVELQRLCARVI